MSNLFFHNTLGSGTEISNSNVGVDGIAIGSPQFASGKFGLGHLQPNSLNTTNYPNFADAIQATAENLPFSIDLL